MRLLRYQEGTRAMKIGDPKIVALRQIVTAAQQEFDMAVAFHEIWRPAAYDQDLHGRLNESFATQAFLVTRTALRREMVLALMRLWDKKQRAVRMEHVRETLSDSKVVDALAQDRVPFPEAIGAMRDDFGEKADKAVSLINKYMKGGSCHAVLETLRALRHERLAHRQLLPATAARANATDEEIEEFYQDNSKLIQVLMSLVNATAYDPQDTAGVYRHYATCFWGGFQENEKTKALRARFVLEV
jgi:AbiU2